MNLRKSMSAIFQIIEIKRFILQVSNILFRQSEASRRGPYDNEAESLKKTLLGQKINLKPI